MTATRVHAQAPAYAVELHRIHVQRIREAARAALAGRKISIRTDGDGDTAFVTWRDPHRHVIASGGEYGMRRLLPLAQAEFARQVEELKKERGAVGV